MDDPKEEDTTPNNTKKDEEDDGMLSSSGFRDESTECAICLGSLEDDDDDMEVIELTTCGHRWHLDCLKQQLEQAQPNPAQRLVLQGCRCAKCGSVCDHPALRNLTRKTDVLLEKVEAVLKEQLSDHEQNSAAALEEARRKFAIYLCSQCREPYFGGTIACADTVDGEVPPAERLCVACAPTRIQQQLSHCRHPLEHRGYHKWKCRYCCKVATHVCYGTVHFCQGCHDRNSERVELIQQQQRQQRNLRQRRATSTTTNNNNNIDTQPPPCLTAIPCPGGDDCPYPKPHGASHHQNGASADCEQAYECALCQSNPSAATDHAFVEPPGSRNLLVNSSGQQGLSAWQQFNPRARWQVEQSDTPLNDTITTNFASSFQWCAMSQFVPLSQYIRDPSRGPFRMEASAKYMGRTDCPSIFRMEVALLNAQRQVLARERTEALSAPADFWERASLILEVPAGAEAHTVVMTIFGKDERFWAGYFGSKVTDCQVRILGEAEELERIMLPEHTQAQQRGVGESSSAVLY